MMQKSLSLTSFRALWILVTIGSVSIGMAYSFNLIQDNKTTWDYYFVNGLIFSGFLGGLGQWALLKDKLSRIWLWIPANTFGFPLGLALGHFLFSVLIFLIPAKAEKWIDYIYLFCVVGIGGLVLGILQYVIIKNEVKYAYWWIPVPVVSWITGLYLSYSIFEILIPSSWNYIWSISGAVFGATIGGIVGTIGSIVIGIILPPSRLNLQNNAS